MMTSVGSERTRGTRDKAQISTTQPIQQQKQVVQATAEQIRLAQMIYDKNDADFEDKVKQLMEVTGKNQDECIVALHDCNGDVNRAINILLEGSSDTTSWETVGGKKKSLGKESSENKENREKRGDREVSRGRGSSNRRGRGGSRGREFRAEENGVDNSQGDRPSDRGKRGRGRGFGRGRGRGAGRFSAQGMGTFNPADYTESSATDGFGTKSEIWETGQNDADDGTGAWKNSIEEWTAEDWNEDLSETKVFTASSIPTENHVTPGQSIDMVTLLQKPMTSTQETEGNSFEASQQQTFGQALVFTNSQHSNQMASGAGSSSAVNSYSPQSLSAVLCSGFGDLGSSKLANSTGSQILDQLKSPGLGQFTSQQNNSSSTTTTTTAPSSWDLKVPITQSSVLSQFDFKSQPEPSPILSQLTQRQQQQTQAVPVPPPGLESFSSQVKLREPSPVDTSTAVSKMLQLPTMSMDNQTVTAHQTHHKQIKPPKRRITPASKIPASAVEMPGSADVTGLNVQFGALEFGSEPALPEFGSASSSENASQTTNNSLYTKSVNDPLNTSLPISNPVQESTYTTSAITSSSLTCSSQSTSPVTTTSSYDQPSVHSRIPYQSSMAPSDPTPVAVTNGHSGVRTQATLDTTSSVSVSKTEPSPSLPSAGSLPSVVSTTTSLLPSASQHVATLPSLPQPNDLASSSLSQLSSSLSNHQSSLSPASVLSSGTSHAHTSVENTTSLQPSTTFSAASTSATSTTSSVVSMASSMNTTNSLGLSVTSVSIPAATTRAAPLVSSGKAPPNLPQGVPPLLHNQYIVGPGGLLPAYPQIYGYDDLQMLQSRLPMDYYGITFPAPATLTGRDGSLANNPYSGDVTKFGRGDSASPAPATTLAQPQQNQTQTHHTTQQPFLNPTLPPGYSYTGLPYYAGVPGVPSAFQYGPTMFVPPASAKQHGVNLNTASTPFQQASGYGQHGYGAGYDDLTQGTAAGDYSKGGYSGSSQAQNKSAGTGPGKGVSVTSSNTGVPDISGSVYNKTQTFDKQGFHAGTPPPFSLPSALGSTGPLNPGAAPGYAPAPFLHILPAHQQPHSQMLHHHLQQDGQGGSSQRNQPSTMQQKSQATKTAYGTSPYWTN
ncbi:ubiquitin-associated protein 2 isoform X4 [Tympanuchus pallidicinctus]|uniref:ubiquitin-associated protein 2 isoform X4 n=1 Tax=Tympanuchus pallidicinctus TaxID=109042 RepID=UPI002286D14F|nr:ubiquitin-associated protein 2 isoform X4 [Tympanuchus pallidicinctus]XP_052526606.1 ubiquitin-associated protein 2 isoform X4 [Tympanuchus pallidicinctus]